MADNKMNGWTEFLFYFIDAYCTVIQLPLFARTVTTFAGQVTTTCIIEQKKLLMTQKKKIAASLNLIERHSLW